MFWPSKPPNLATGLLNSMSCSLCKIKVKTATKNLFQANWSANCDCTDWMQPFEAHLTENSVCSHTLICQNSKLNLPSNFREVKLKNCYTPRFWFQLLQRVFFILKTVSRSSIFANTKECKPKEWITKSSSNVGADAKNAFSDSLPRSFLSSFAEGIWWWWNNGFCIMQATAYNSWFSNFQVTWYLWSLMIYWMFALHFCYNTWCFFIQLQ